MEKISTLLGAHYQKTFEQYGPTAKGVDWRDQETAQIRYEKMLAVILPELMNAGTELTLLDVGCGFGGLGFYIRENELPIRYSGLDIADNMIEYGRANLTDATFYNEDFLGISYLEPFDFLVCNGILTQKLTASIREMEIFSKNIVQKMFDLCRIGIAFNNMTNQVNYMKDNLFYKSPVEMMAFCLSQISPKIRIDHSYKLFEYTTYIYR